MGLLQGCPAPAMKERGGGVLALLLVPPESFLLRCAIWSMSIVCLAAGVVLQALQWCRRPPGQVTGIRRVRSGQAKPFPQFPPALKNQKPGLDPNLPSPRLLGAGMGQGQGWVAAAGGVGRCLGASQQLRASPACAGWRLWGCPGPVLPPRRGHAALIRSRGHILQPRLRLPRVTSGGSG